MSAVQSIPLPKRFDLGEVVANSYRDFHCKGLDYICLRRSAEITLKLYFFDGDVSKLPEVVHPHDHRYPFETFVVAGRSENIIYRIGAGEHPCATFNHFRYDTPLNGGAGFSWAGEVELSESNCSSYLPGTGYAMRHDQIHTIRMLANETVLFLVQYEDAVRRAVPTSTFTRSDQAPSLSGLYGRFTPDQVLARLKRFEERTGYRFEKP